MIEGADVGSSTSAVATDESGVIMDERIALNTSQAEGVHARYSARQDLSRRLAFAEQMVGIQGRQVAGGELSGDNPNLMLKPMTNGAID